MQLEMKEWIAHVIDTLTTERPVNNHRIQNAQVKFEACVHEIQLKDDSNKP